MLFRVSTSSPDSWGTINKWFVFISNLYNRKNQPNFTIWFAGFDTAGQTITTRRDMQRVKIIDDHVNSSELTISSPFPVFFLNFFLIVQWYCGGEQSIEPDTNARRRKPYQITHLTQTPPTEIPMDSLQKAKVAQIAKKIWSFS